MQKRVKRLGVLCTALALYVAEVPLLIFIIRLLSDRQDIRRYMTAMVRLRIIRDDGSCPMDIWNRLSSIGAILSIRMVK